MANDINRVVLSGRLTRDADVTVTPSGFVIIKIAVAANRSRKQGDDWVEEGHFFDATIYGRRGEALQNYLKKGQRIFLEGKLKQDRWEQPDGSKRSRVSIDIDEISLEGGRSTQESNYSEQPQAPRFTPQKPATQPVTPYAADAPFDDSDIPF